MIPEPQNLFRFKLEDLMWENRIKSINELSEKTNISRSALTALKNGDAKMLHLSTLYTLCKHFNCGINDLVELKKGG